MPRRSRRDAVAERAAAHLTEQQERRCEAAQRGTQTRRQRRAEQLTEAQLQPAADRRAHAPTTRRSRLRAHADMLTVAVRGPLAAKMRQLAESTSMSLARLLQDSVLVYGGQVDAGYEPGTALAR